MTENIAQWTNTQLVFLEAKTKLYSEPERNSASASYIQKVLQVTPAKINTEDELNLFQAKVEKLLTLLPEKKMDEKLSFGKYNAELRGFKNYIKEKFNLVPKGYYKAIWLPLGIALGIPYGLLFKNLALGLPIGLALGVAVGTALDRKAEKEGRVM